ncbi:TIGR00270 family protein [Candidatus Woesearchaeota archaeon]|nr:TIGR00270 family protein [Candidatus Woesearchaeota archaeon]
MSCELCGKETELVKAVVEGIELSVCAKCGRYGRIIAQKPAAATITRREKKEPAKEKTITVTPGYGKLIKHKREQKGITQKEFAKLIAEKESLIHKIEVQEAEPNIEFAAKIEKALGIKILQEAEEDEVISLKQPKKDALTLGDFVKVKKR